MSSVLDSITKEIDQLKDENRRLRLNLELVQKSANPLGHLGDTTTMEKELIQIHRRLDQIETLIKRNGS